jgi:hypothetical protein
VKKQRLNQRRSFHGSHPAVTGSTAEETEDERGKVEVEGRELSGELVDYVQVVTSLIEGRWIRRGEIILLLGRILRQHSIAREQRMDYVMRYLSSSSPGG